LVNSGEFIAKSREEEANTFVPNYRKTEQVKELCNLRSHLSCIYVGVSLNSSTALTFDNKHMIKK